MAQNDGPLVIPVDIFACTYNDGEGPADLDKAIAAWTKYVDESDNPDDYAAWTLTKHYAGDEQDFDFLWLGAWKSGNAMGAGWDAYMQDGAKIQAGFDKVADCGAAGNFASINHRQTPNNNTPSDGVLVFSDCTRNDGVSNANVAEAMRTWSAVLDENGIEMGIFHWFPIFGGGGEQTFDFKEIAAFENHAALGAFYEKMGNGRLFVRNEEIFAPIMSCDIARVYNANNRRATQLRK